MCDRKRLSINHADAVTGAVFAAGPTGVLVVDARGASMTISDGSPLHAVPVIDVVSHSNWLAEGLYRIFEILFAAIALILTLPLMVLEAVLIRWDSPGPALFFHTRPGRSKIVRGSELEDQLALRPPSGGYDPNTWYYVPNYFQLMKFRTMYSDAQSRFPELYAYDFASEEFHQQYGTYRHDPRVTRIGGILRKLSVDELPNLWSVLVGNMRLVGPRPEAPEVLRYYTPDEMYKFACKPGVTGLAQINGRGLLNWGETIAWDLEYVRTRTVWLDLKIILITLYYVIMRRGAF
jgi:lipopolysaccharide/colanic/teichoic acid biosynthesis glycosyltransferase